MYQIVIIVHVLVAIALIVLVLIQHGKGADIGAAFGSGASNTVFGSQGAGGFLFKLTGTLAAAFFATSLALGYIVSHQYRSTQQVVLPQPIQQTKEQTIPVPVQGDLKKSAESK